MNAEQITALEQRHSVKGIDSENHNIVYFVDDEKKAVLLSYYNKMLLIPKEHVEILAAELDGILKFNLQRT